MNKGVETSVFCMTQNTDDILLSLHAPLHCRHLMLSRCSSGSGNGSGSGSGSGVGVLNNTLNINFENFMIKQEKEYFLELIALMYY